jgi:tetratricopeptide (TPR) repeat protein
MYLEFLDACLCSAEGNKAEAIRKLTIFLEAHRDVEALDAILHIDALEQLGRALIDLGKYSEAISPLERALISAESAQRKRLCFYLGQCYFQHHRWQDAAEKLIQSLPTDRSDPWWTPAQQLLGICHIETGELDAAERELLQTLPADRQSAQWTDVQFHLGRLYFHRGDYLRAKQTFELCEFFVNETELSERLAGWLTATRAKLDDRRRRDM